MTPAPDFICALLGYIARPFTGPWTLLKIFKSADVNPTTRIVLRALLRGKSIGRAILIIFAAVTILNVAGVLVDRAIPYRPVPRGMNSAMSTLWNIGRSLKYLSTNWVVVFPVCFAFATRESLRSDLFRALRSVPIEGRAIAESLLLICVVGAFIAAVLNSFINTVFLPYHFPPSSQMHSWRWLLHGFYRYRDSVHSFGVATSGPRIVSDVAVEIIFQVIYFVDKIAPCVAIYVVTMSFKKISHATVLLCVNYLVQSYFSYFERLTFWITDQVSPFQTQGTIYLVPEHFLWRGLATLIEAFLYLLIAGLFVPRFLRIVEEEFEAER